MPNLTIEELEKKFGSVQYEGRKYVLTRAAYCDDPLDGPFFFRSNAICPDDNPDDDIRYEITWETTEAFEELLRECSESGDWLDEGDACDWDNPYNVRRL